MYGSQKKLFKYTVILLNCLVLEMKVLKVIGNQNELNNPIADIRARSLISKTFPFKNIGEWKERG